MSLPHIRYEAHEERDLPSVCGWIRGQGGTGESIWVPLDCSAAEQVVELVEQFENWAADQLHDAGLRRCGQSARSTPARHADWTRRCGTAAPSGSAAAS